MAVHKLTSDEVAKTEPARVLITSDDEQRQQHSFQATEMQADEKFFFFFFCICVQKNMPSIGVSACKVLFILVATTFF